MKTFAKVLWSCRKYTSGGSVSRLNITFRFYTSGKKGKRKTRKKLVTILGLLTLGYQFQHTFTDGKSQSKEITGIGRHEVLIQVVEWRVDISLPQCRKFVSEKTAIWEKRCLLFNDNSYNLWAGLCHTYVQLQPLSTEPYSLTTFLSLAYQNIHTYKIFLWCSNCSIIHGYLQPFPRNFSEVLTITKCT